MVNPLASQDAALLPSYRYIVNCNVDIAYLTLIPAEKTNKEYMLKKIILKLEIQLLHVAWLGLCLCAA